MGKARPINCILYFVGLMAGAGCFA